MSDHQYRDEQQAVTRAVNSGEGRPKPADWQRQFNSGYRTSDPADCQSLSGIDKLLADTMTHARIRRAMSPALFNVLLVKHSGNEKDRIAALSELIKVVGTQAGPNCKALAIGSWASPTHKTNASVNWDQQDVSDRTLRHWRSEIRKELKDMYAAAMEAARQQLKEDGLINALEPGDR